MSVSDVLAIFKDAAITALKLSAPMLITSIVLGLVISILQTATQIHEQTLTFVPKLLAVVAVLLLLGSWMISTIMDFTYRIYEIMATYV